MLTRLFGWVFCLRVWNRRDQGAPEDDREDNLRETYHRYRDRYALQYRWDDVATRTTCPEYC